MQSLKKKKFVSTFTYDEKIAKGFCKIDYYKAYKRKMKMHEYLNNKNSTCLDLVCR